MAAGLLWTTGQARSLRICCATDVFAFAGLGTVSAAVQPVPSGQTVVELEQEVCRGGQKVAVAGQLVSIGGQLVAIAGHLLTDVGQEV
jgi:hypothetical protein